MLINKNEKFSIRKYKFGAASVLLGTCLAIGLSASGEAKASETASDETKLDSSHIASNNPNSTTQADKNISNEAAIHNETAIPKDTMIGNNEVEKIESTNNDEKIKTDETENTLKNENITKVEDSTQENNRKNNDNAQFNTINNNEKTDSSEQTTPHSESTSDDGHSQNGARQSPPPQNNELIAESRSTLSNDHNTSNNSPKRSFVANNIAKPNVELARSENTEGTDISDKITVVNSNIESNDTIRPHNGEKSTLKYGLTFGEGIKAGDYFDISLSNNVNTRGVSLIGKVPEIKNGETIIANGRILEDGKIRYTFTDYVNNKENLKTNLSLNLFIDPKMSLKIVNNLLLPQLMDIRHKRMFI